MYSEYPVGVRLEDYSILSSASKAGVDIWSNENGQVSRETALPNASSDHGTTAWQKGKSLLVLGYISILYQESALQLLPQDFQFILPQIKPCNSNTIPRSRSRWFHEQLN